MLRCAVRVIDLVSMKIKKRIVTRLNNEKKIIRCDGVVLVNCRVAIFR